MNESAISNENQTTEQEANGEEVELLIDNIYENEPEQQSDATEPEEANESDEPTEEPEQTDEDEISEDEANEQDEPKFKIKVQGNEVEVTEEELKQLAQKGADYTRKTMALAKYRNLIESLEQYGITSVDDLNNFLASGGSLNDLKEVEEQVSHTEPVEAVANEILSQPNADEFKGFVATLPEPAKEVLASNAQLLAQTYNAFSSGEWDRYGAETMRQFALTGYTDLQGSAMRAKQIVDGSETKRRKKVKGASQPANSFSSLADEAGLSDAEYQKMAQKFMSL